MTAFIELKHASVLVTGGSDGIGREIAARYLGAGSSVLVTGRKHDFPPRRHEIPFYSY